jgi:hypothetical protein
MVMRARRLIAPLALIFALATATTASAAVWHASPHGDGHVPCKSTDPCSLDLAANGAPPNTEVVVAQGTYDAVHYDVRPGVYIHGTGDLPYPLIVGAVDTPMFRLGKDDHLRYLRIHQQQDYAAAIDANRGTIENVVVEGSGNPEPDLYAAVYMNGGTMLRDSVVWSPSENALGIRHGEGYSEIRNVTVWTPNDGGIAVETAGGCASGCPGHNAYTDASNLIAHGAENGYDLRVNAKHGPATLSVRNSNYRAGAVQVETGAHLYDNGGNQTTVEPKLRNPVAGDFHELPGSPTNDAGTFAAPVTRLDLGGLARVLGQAPDIGAFELQNPTVATLGPTEVKAHAATLKGAAIANGKETTAHFELGLTSKYGLSTPPVDVGTSSSPVPVSTTAALLAGKTYHYRAVATNADGTSYGADKTLTTPAVPFAGVTIKAQSVKVKNGRAPVTVSCSKDTSGACKGSLALGKLGKLGSTKLTLLPGQALTVKVKLTKSGRARLKQAKQLKAVATATARDGAGHVKTTSAKVTLKKG